MAGAAGCRLYVISNDEQDPQQVYVTEIWDDKTAHDASLQMPEVRQLIQQAMPLLDGMPTGGQELTILVVMAFEYLYPNFSSDINRKMVKLQPLNVVRKIRIIPLF